MFLAAPINPDFRIVVANHLSGGIEAKVDINSNRLACSRNFDGQAYRRLMVRIGKVDRIVISLFANGSLVSVNGTKSVVWGVFFRFTVI